MHLSTIATVALFGVAVLTPADANAQQRQRGPETYQARGTEPFWSVTVGGSTIRWESPNTRTVTVNKPRPIVGFNGERYVTPRLTVDITHVPCSDGMSDFRYHDTVVVTLDRRTYRGCGGERIASAPTNPAFLGEWRVRSIAGQPVARGTNVTVNFADQRVSGNTGCNSFSGGYRFTRGTLNIGPLMTTKRACVGRPGNLQEQNLLGLLGRPLTLRLDRALTNLTLTAPGGRVLVLVRDRPGRR